MSVEALASKIVYIYTLSDPRMPDSVRYVGVTIHPPQRLREHIASGRKDNRTHRTYWIASLLQQTQIPTMSVIEEVTEETWEDRERYWISRYRELGCALVNSTDGGKGISGATQAVRREIAKRRAANCLRDFTGEIFANLTVLEDQGGQSTRSVTVQCSCGIVTLLRLKHWGKQKTCGQCTAGICVKEGMKFGPLTVTRIYSVTKVTGYRQRVAECVCDCGGVSRRIYFSHLVNRITKSCLSCSRARSAAAKRIPDKGPLYKSWQSAMAKVCASRGKDRPGEKCTYEEFKSWAMKHGYVEGLFLVRKDVSRGTSLDNLYWSKNRKPSAEERAKH